MIIRREYTQRNGVSQQSCRKLPVVVQKLQEFQVLPTDTASAGEIEGVKEETG
jgi:hypothetical protein